MYSKIEQKIQHQIIKWCKEQGLKIYGSANGQYLNTWSGRAERAALGKGLPDLFILIPKHKSKSDLTTMLILEVKSLTGRATPEQKEFIGLVDEIDGNVFGAIKKGYDKSIEWINGYVKPMPKLTIEEVNEIINNL